MELYTITQMSKLLRIPESTIRFYRDKYSEYFHYTGKGKKKRYLPETLDVLRLICDQSGKSKNAEQIAEALQAQFIKQIDIAESEAVETQPQKSQNSLQLFQTMTTAIIEIADQKKEIENLRNEVRELREIITIPLFKRIFKKKNFFKLKEEA
jgi:DNA-binding transcriptional MerR regulator